MLASQTIRSTAARHLIAGSIAALAAFAAAPAEAGTVTLQFEGCTAAQQRSIAHAFDLAALAVDEVVEALAEPSPIAATQAAVDRWFGDEISHYALVRQYKHIANRLDDAALPIRAECDLSSQDFAWTYLAMQGTGYMGFGRAFFAADAIGGFDSRMGTVVHELSHMVPGIAADDHYYDIPSMEAIAHKEPEMALDNAQNYEYLVEELYDILIDGPTGASFVISGLGFRQHG